MDNWIVTSCGLPGLTFDRRGKWYVLGSARKTRAGELVLTEVEARMLAQLLSWAMEIPQEQPAEPSDDARERPDESVR